MTLPDYDPMWSQTTTPILGPWLPATDGYGGAVAVPMPLVVMTSRDADDHHLVSTPSYIVVNHEGQLVDILGVTLLYAAPSATWTEAIVVAQEILASKAKNRSGR